MKRAFMLSPSGEVVSAVIPKEEMPNAFQPGTRLKLQRMLDLSPYAILMAGTWVTVLAHCAATGSVDLVFDHVVAGLHQWGQTLTLIPFDTDDTLVALNSALELNPRCVMEVA